MCAHGFATGIMGWCSWRTCAIPSQLALYLEAWPSLVLIEEISVAASAASHC
jgi:hypothetical protein